MASGGDQYIHQESSVRQGFLQECFRHSSAVAFEKAGILADDKTQQVLEIGCGTGLTTLDIARMLPQAHITAIDTDPTLIAKAQQMLDPSLAPHIDFVVQNGERADAAWAGRFDAVWMRFVVIHVPDPVALVQAAANCLKRGGILLIEDADARGDFSDPPLFANEFINGRHIEASLRLGADVRRGPLMGQFMRDAGLVDLNCDIFVPLFGKGVAVKPWCGSETTAIGPCHGPSKHFELGFQFLRMTLESLAPKFLELEVCTEDEIRRAKESLDEVDKREYQIFTLPGGKVFQWWGTKK
jgi:SAM-dependent methyltransferase